MSRRPRIGQSVQCEAVTRTGRRCGVTTDSTFRDPNSQSVAEPLRRGASTCAFHLELFCTRPAPGFDGEVCILRLDLGTSRLDTLSDDILEVALTEDRSNAQFATTVRPLLLPDGPPGVHGIGRDELLSSPPFGCVFGRMLRFLRNVVESTLVESGDSSDEGIADDDRGVRHLVLRDPVPQVLLAGHNGMKFDFPLFVSAILKHDCNLFELAEFYFCDTLPAMRVCGAHIADGCARLQCLAARCCCSAGGVRAHRALDDTVVLRSVVHHCATATGVTPQALLKPFARSFDVNATLVARSFVV